MKYWQQVYDQHQLTKHGFSADFTSANGKFLQQARTEKHPQGAFSKRKMLERLKYYPDNTRILSCMPRPTLLVAEREPLQALSTRKLVLETAKFNVLTAHSTAEALDLFRAFPNISMAVLAIHEPIDCARIAHTIRESRSNVPIVVLTNREVDTCDFADHRVSAYDPEGLVQLVRSILGDPRRLERPSPQ